MSKLRERQYGGLGARAVTIIAATMSVYHILYIAAVLERMGIFITPVPHRALSMCFVLVLCFLLMKGGKKTPVNRLPWYDVFLIVLSLGVTLYVFIGYERWLIYRHGMPTTVDTIVGAIIIVLILEGGRRVLGLALPLIVTFFIFHSLFANYFPGFLHSGNRSLSHVLGHICMSAAGVWGIPMGVAATVVISFVIFGQFLQGTGAGRFFIDSCLSMFGRMRGGPAKVAVTASAIFGSISGSTAANVATTGIITIPMMKRVGYSSDFAGGVESVASNGGQILPPVMGAVAFVMCEFLGIPYFKLCAAALLPAVLYFAGVFLIVDLQAGKTGLKGLSKDEIPFFWTVFKNGWKHLISIVVLLVFLLGLYYTPERSVLYALIAVVIVNILSKTERLNVKGIIWGLEYGARTMIMVSLACGLAGIIIGCLTLTGVGVKLTSVFITVAGDNLLLMLIMVALASFILGMGMSSVPCYVMVVMLAAPALIKLGVPELSAHLFAFYWGLASFITPPVALAAYAASAIAESEPMKTGLQASRVGLLMYIVPFLFIYRPGLLMMAPPIQVLGVAIITLIGIISLVIGVMGYFLYKVSLWERLFFVAAAFAIFYPSMTADVGGVCVVALLVTRHLWRSSSRPGRILRAEGESRSS